MLERLDHEFATFDSRRSSGLTQQFHAVNNNNIWIREQDMMELIVVIESGSDKILQYKTQLNSPRKMTQRVKL